MKKIISSERNYRILAIIILSIYFLLIYLFSNNRNLVPLLLSYALVCLIIPYLIVRFEKRKIKNGIFFNQIGVLLYFNDTLKEKLDWDEVEIKEIPTRLKIQHSMMLEFTSNRRSTGPFYLHLTWFNEDSLIELTKRYVPDENSFYKLISEYCNKRGIMF